MTKDELLNKYAVGEILTDSAETPYDELMSQLWDGNLPDDVIVWQPFESHTPEQLAERIEEARDIFQCFGEDWEKTTD